jgi:hypothetical protein
MRKQSTWTGLKRFYAILTADICPTNVEELYVVMSGYKRLVSFLLRVEEKMKAVASLVDDTLNNRLK